MEWYVLCLLTFTCTGIVAADYELVILHTNDVHAHVEEFNKYGSECSQKDSVAKACFGGYARQASVVKEIRARDQNVVLLSGGDWSQGTAWYYMYEGAATAMAMNMLNYSAGAIGNHEFDKGVDVFISKFAKKADFPILSANTDASKEPIMQGHFNKSTILEVGGKRIGVIGYTTSNMPELSLSYGNLLFTNEVEAVKKEAKLLKAAGIDIILAVGHSGFPTDTSIAAQVPDVDVVIGGHDNTFLYTGTQPSNDKPKGPYPTVVQQNEGGKQVPVLVVQDFMFGKYLGYLKVKFSDAGEVKTWSGNPIMLNGTYQEDPELKAALEPMKQRLEKIKSQTIGEAYVSLDAFGTDNYCRKGECNIGNVMTDAMIYSNLRKPVDRKWASVALAVWNSGGIRSGMNTDMSGSITYSQILEAFPFGNVVDIVVVSGQTVWEMFQHSASAIEDESGRFLQVSGFKVVYDITKVVGRRVVSVHARCADCAVPRYLPLDRSANYSILVSNFVAGGGDGYTMLRDNRLNYIPLGFIDQAVVRDFINKTSPIFTGIEGRSTFIKGNTTSSVTLSTAPSTTDEGGPTGDATALAPGLSALLPALAVMLWARW